MKQLQEQISQCCEWNWGKKTDEYESFAVTAPLGFRRQLSVYLWPNEAFCTRFHCFCQPLLFPDISQWNNSVRERKWANSAKLSGQGNQREGSWMAGRDDWSCSVIRPLGGNPSADTQERHLVLHTHWFLCDLICRKFGSISALGQFFSQQRWDEP